MYRNMYRLCTEICTDYVQKYVQIMYRNMYRLPFSLQKRVNDKIEELEQLDIIEKVNSASKWVSPIVVASIIEPLRKQP